MSKHLPHHNSPVHRESGAERISSRRLPRSKALANLCVPESAEVLKLRDEMLDLRSCKTDHDLMNLVIAARMHGADGWLVRAASDDKAASEQWRRRRAIMLHAFLDGERPAVPS